MRSKPRPQTSKASARSSHRSLSSSSRHIRDIVVEAPTVSAHRTKRVVTRYPEALSLTAQNGLNTIKTVRAVDMSGVEMPWRAAVAVPARDEERRIIRCLTALRAAIRKTVDPIGIVVVVNNAHDATHALAANWLSRAGLPYMLLDVDFADDWAFVGSARRLSLDLAAEMVENEGLLFTTDADSAVDEDWVVDGYREILDRADLVCGTILRFEDEQDRLPEGLAERWAPESDYVSLSVELAARLDPRPHDPLPAHWNIGGADLVFKKPLYEAVGGMPVLASGEDRAFVSEAERQDHRVVYSSNVVVRTSCRLVGRATGGMANSLVSWIVDHDPFCDDRLTDAAASGRRFWLRGCLRRLGNGAAGDALLNQLGLNPDIARRRTGEPFGKFWDRIDALCFRMDRRRLRVSDLVRERPALSKMVGRLRAGDGPMDDLDHVNAWVAQCARGDA